MKGAKLFLRLLLVFTLSNFLLSQIEYSKEDLNSTSDSYGQMIWQPTYSGYITLHYFTTQG